MARPALAPVAARRLARDAGAVEGVSPLLDLAFGFNAFGITVRPGQVRSEFSALLAEVEVVRPQRMLEIGTANGGSLFCFARLAHPSAHIISVDLPHGDFGGGYPPWKLPLYRAFANPSQRLDLIRDDSHAASTLERVTALLGGAPLDFLFIDGDHTYDGVRQDYETFSPLVCSGGLIAFHDIAEPDPQVVAESGIGYDVGEVPRFWSELRTRPDAQEFISGSGRGFGIGAIRG